MRNRNSNIILRGTAILLLSIALVLAIVSLIGYSRQRDFYPGGMTIAGVPVGGLDPQAASQRVLEVYNSPIQIQYNGGIIDVDPTVIGFQMDIESMLAAADLARTGGSFWGGFWNYLWNRTPPPIQVPLRATIAEDRLRAYLQSEVGPRYDQSSTPAEPIPGTPNYTLGKPSQTLDIDRAVPLIDGALQSPTSRVVVLSFTRVAVARPTIQDLELQLKQIISTSGFDGVIGFNMIDLQNGQEIHFALNQGQEVPVQPDLAFAAQSTMKIPILVSYFIQHGTAPVDSDTDAKILAMIHASDNPSSDDMMRVIDPNIGPLIVTRYMQKLGLANTFIIDFYCSPESPCPPLQGPVTTPADQRSDASISNPDTFNETTTSDMGMLLEDVYQCAQNGGGALVAAFPNKIDKDVCNKIINYLEQDKIGQLIEAGVPDGTVVAMKHGWISRVPGGGLTDISAAGIVYSTGGNFVISVYTYEAPQNFFDPTNLLIANLTKAVYNYYNLPTE
ncbi:MAG TPA: serine hydrolase [Anaerolineales bacterium]|nr:serine hydrolase [Anaerolineales bacterium]